MISSIITNKNAIYYLPLEDYIVLKAVIFDMDGVIIDSEPMHARANVLALKKFNVDVPLSYCYEFIGSTTYYMCQKMIEDFHLDASPEALLLANNEMKEYLLNTEGHTVVPYIIDLIKDLHLHGIRMIIASSSPASAIEEVMQSMQIEQFFEGYISGMQIENPKPAPDIFLAAVKQLGLKKDECIIIEDSKNGVNAAFAADITCIGFVNPNSGNQDLSKAAILVEGFDEIDYKFINKVYQHDHMEPATILTTNRIILRELSVDDIDELCRIYSELKTIQFLDTMLIDPILEKEKHIAYIKNMYQLYGFGLWGVFRKEDNRLIGRCGIEFKIIDGKEEYEIGYLIANEYQRQGYGSEAADAVIKYCFEELQIPSIVAIIDKKNLPSIQLANKLNMIKISVCQINSRSCYKYIAVKP